MKKQLSRATAPKAKSKKLIQAWLILSNKKEDYKHKFFLNDLLFWQTQTTLEKANGRKLWTLLAENGIYLHPSLENQYRQQRICFWDGAEIITRKADEGNYEEVCSECGYLYLEK